jgi:hypothetical protein
MQSALPVFLWDGLPIRPARPRSDRCSQHCRYSFGADCQSVLLGRGVIDAVSIVGIPLGRIANPSYDQRGCVLAKLVEGEAWVVWGVCPSVAINLNLRLLSIPMLLVRNEHFRLLSIQKSLLRSESVAKNRLAKLKRRLTMRIAKNWFHSVLMGSSLVAGLQSWAMAEEDFVEDLPAIVSAKSLRNDSAVMKSSETSNSRAEADDSVALASFTQGGSFDPYQGYSSDSSGHSPFHLASHHDGSSMMMDSGASTCCQPSQCCVPCCEPWWAHRNSGFGEVLYLWPGNSDLIYAVEQTDTTNTASPTGPLGITNVDEAVGFRVGFSKRRDMCTSLFGTFARWDNDTVDTLDATGTRVLNSRLIHPSTATVGSQSLQSSTYQLINFQTADAGIRRVYKTTNCSAINWMGGLRYGNLEQGLIGEQTIQTATGLTTVTTDIDFDGFGILGGLDGERRSKCHGGLVYGRILGSLLAGDWRADYQQVNQFGGGVIANQFEDFRVTPVLEAELGFGLVSKSGKIKLTAGYLFTNWFNTVSTRDYIRNVRSGNLEDMADVLTFSGLTSRIELRF